MRDENFEINFTATAFNAEEQRSTLQGKRRYTRAVADAQKAVEALDSQDDFRKLVIDRSLYAKDKRYGIDYVKGVHAADGRVILAHQENAAESFLRDLRGFGLLADVVGSGKTYEAGVILSELAVRGKVKSLLIVTPDQVFDTWVDVLENKFGLGQGVLYAVRKPADGADAPALEDILEVTGVRKEGDFIRPARPIIVDADVFAQWRYSADLLVDVIVVDEAHHLSEDTGKYTGAMKLLSEMMQTKKRAEATYCLLLSATPHSGNLENMFRLWYFVRCKGGNPADFEEKDDKDRTPQYLAEKRYYKEYICHGAANVTEFIRRVKFLEVSERYAKEFLAYIEQSGIADYAARSEYEKTLCAENFLAREENAEIEASVIRSVARAYHNGVLRSIMIRQPNRLSPKKKIFNYFFYPMHRPADHIVCRGLAEESITLDFSALSENGFPLVVGLVEPQPLDAYIESHRGNRPFPQAYAQLANGMINAFKAADAGEPLFTKKGYETYYAARLAAMPGRIGNNSAILPVQDSADKLGYKFEWTKSILQRHAGSRALIFFDYELHKKESAAEAFCAALASDKEFSGRLIVGNATADMRKIERAFNDKSDAILIVTDAKFTEGANLQASNVIINYEVTPDPLAMDQRIGRIFRLGQKSDVFIYSLADMNKLEGFALAYFSSIGLLDSNSGDATILAGSNSDRMVALRCNECGRVRLMPKAAYEEKKRNSPVELLCRATPNCVALSPDEKGTEMTEITVYDFKCDTCGTVLTRSVFDGYMCLSHVESGEKGRMCNGGEKGDRSVYCRKICALSHCKRFSTDPLLVGKCAALNKYRKNPNCPESELLLSCELCTNAACWSGCKLSGAGKADIADCSVCEYAGCSPAPYVLAFDEKWEAECPMPGCRLRRPHGKLKPIVARTFATFISEAWKFVHDGGESFCKNLNEEAERVAQVKRVLELDNTEGK